MKVRLLATHPVQYQVPWFRALAGKPGLDFEVGFALLPDPKVQGVGFEQAFEWDRPLLEGYPYRCLEQTRTLPRLDRFWGLGLRRVRAWLRGVQALIVTGWNSWALVQGVLAARRQGIPVVVRGDSWLADGRSELRRGFVRLWLRQFAAFLVVGSRNRDYYRAHGVRDAKLFPAPHGVDHEWFSAQAEQATAERDTLRQRWGVGASELLLLFVGKLQPIKNLPELLHALATPENRTMPLLVVGSGPEERACKQLARELGLRVLWHGFANQSELPALYRAADLLVLPSLRETWGLVVNEAMACGLPVVASDRVGCVPDLILPDQTGWIYPSGDRAALAALLAAIRSAPERVRRLGEHARKHVRATCDLSRLVEGTLAALRWVASGRGA